LVIRTKIFTFKNQDRCKSQITKIFKALIYFYTAVIHW